MIFTTESSESEEEEVEEEEKAAPFEPNEGESPENVKEKVSDREVFLDADEIILRKEGFCERLFKKKGSLILPKDADADMF